MNITYIFGNGFDLQAGLRTRYSDFLEEYIQPSKNDSDNIRDFKRELSDRKSNAKWWSDAEAAMGKHLGRYSDKTVADYFERVQDFESEMVEYLLRQQDQCGFASRATIDSAFQDFIYFSFEDFLHGKTIDLHTTESNSFHFLSFNYTTVLDRVVECCMESKNAGIVSRRAGDSQVYDWIYRVCHLHGSLETSIVMGVNDESQLCTDGGISITPELQWKIIKPVMNTVADLPGANEAMQIIERSDVIAIYGVSFGDTDRLWWSKIIDWLESNENHVLVLFRHNREATFNRSVAWVNIERSRQYATQVLTKMFGGSDLARINNLIGRVRVVVDTKRLPLTRLLRQQDMTTV